MHSIISPNSVNVPKSHEFQSFEDLRPTCHLKYLILGMKILTTFIERPSIYASFAHQDSDHIVAEHL